MDLGRVERAFVAALAVVSTSCSTGDGGPSGSCQDPEPTAAACCEPTVYTRTTITTLVTASGSFLGRDIEVEGVGDWYQGLSEDPCTCAGSTCACNRPAALTSVQCGVSIVLSGTYQGRPVECSNAGCWPLTAGARFAVCGRWAWESTLGTTGTLALRVDGICPRGGS